MPANPNPILPTDRPIATIKVARDGEGNLIIRLQSALIEETIQRLNGTTAPSVASPATSGLRGYRGSKLTRPLSNCGCNTDGWGMWGSYPTEYISSLWLAVGLKDGIELTIPAAQWVFDDSTVDLLRDKLRQSATAIYTNLICTHEASADLFVRTTTPTVSVPVEE